MRNLKVACGMIAVTLLCGFKVRDYNKDGEITVACLGDSNTDTSWSSGRIESYCSYLSQMDPRLRHFPNGWKVLNYGISGSTLVDHGRYQFEKAISGDSGVNKKADVVILAFGTNDILYHSTDRILLEMEALLLRSRYERVRTLIALAPPAVCLRDAARIAELNEAIRLRISSKFILDFNSGFIANWEFGSDFSQDCVHLNPQGQMKRASIVYRKIACKSPVRCAISFGP